MIKAERGDLMFTRGDTGLAKAIQWAERTRGESPTWANHVGIVVEPGYILPCKQPAGPFDELGPAWVVESLWKTIEHPWFPAQKPGYEVSIWRYDAMTELQSEVAANRARLFVGAKYGWWKLFTHLIDNKVLGGRVVTRRLLSNDSRPICSYTVARAFSSAGIHTGTIPPGAQSPDSIWDFTHKDDLWFEVGRGVVEVQA